MQLIFSRNAENTSIEIKDGVSTIEFSYVEMIKRLIKEEILEDTVFIGDITPEEKEKVVAMLEKINQAMSKEEETEI
jgi:hypothetical protein